MNASVNDTRSVRPRTLEESMYATIAYFDLFDYPLTPQELWTYLFYPPAGCTISEMLEKSKTHSELEWSQGFIHAKGRGCCVQERIGRYLHTERKVRKALRFARLASLVPGVAMIALCNTLALSHARDSSDIDVFIVARKGYLWFVRAACIVLSLFFGPRLSEQHMRDALCLSFFIRRDACDLSPCALNPSCGIDDVYLSLWVSRCVPMYDEGGQAQAFWEANRWTENSIPHRIPYIPNHMRSIHPNGVLRAVKKILTIILFPFQARIERTCAMIQKKRFPERIRRAASSAGSGVVITDQILKFHLNDRREYFQQALIERLRSCRISQV
ncbi:MAG: hypothetical protein AAB400_04130 [Patescibacteria group bacterium]